MSERASLTQNTKLGAALWIGDRLVARIAGTVENSRITPDAPVPQWRKDAMTFVDAVNAAALAPERSADSRSPLFSGSARAGGVVKVIRVEIQRRELDVAIAEAPEGVIRRAAVAMAALLDGGTVIVEERIGELPGGEVLVEETMLEAMVPS